MAAVNGHKEVPIRDEISEIPVINFANWDSGAPPQERAAIAKTLIEACQTFGFANIINHGLDANLLAEAFQWSKKLFDLSAEDKMKAPHPAGSAVHRGYSYPGLEKVSQVMNESGSGEVAKKLREVQDCKESYEIGSDDFKNQPNVWLPEETLPGYRAFMTKFYWECAIIAKKILKVIALGIGLDDETLLLKGHTGLNNQLRLLHYPPIPAIALESGSMARMPAHADWSSITFLFQDDCGGLEVESPTTPGKFIAAKPMKNGLVMNVGDLLMRWSNDRLKSTLHRVTLPPLQDRYTGKNRMTRARYSIPYFIAPDPDTVVECFPSCQDAEHPALYEPITQEAYCIMRATAHYPDAEKEAAKA